MSEEQLVGDDAVTKPPVGQKRRPSLSSLSGLASRGGALAGRASGLVGEAARLARSLPGTLSLPRDDVRGGSESITGYVPGHRMAAGARVARAAVALTFEGDEIRVLQHFGSRVVGWGAFRLESSQLSGGQVLDAPGLGDTLDDLFDRGGFSRRHVVGAISGWQAKSSLLEMPLARSDAGIEEVVAEEAAAHLGHVPGESYLFWQRAGRMRHSRAVFAVVIPQEPLLLVLEALESAGVRPDALDLKPLALARAVNQRDAIVASLEADSLDIVIVADDLPVVVRSVPLPAGTTDTARRAYFVGEIARAFADSRGSRAPLDAEAKIYLAGALVDESLGDQLRLQTGHEVGRLAPPVYCPLDFPVAEQLANVGLLLKED